MNLFDESTKKSIEKDIERDFEDGLSGIRKLPKGARFGVYVAYVYFFALLRKIKRTSAVLHAQQVPVDKEREQYFAMKETKDGALNLFFRLKPLDLARFPILLAYRGAASTASAGSAGGVFKKLRSFSDGRSELEQAVNLRPGDPEIRFLRLATQLNAPAFLGYNAAVEDDKNQIINSMCQLNPNDSNAYLYYRISEFLLNTTILTSEERRKVSLCKEKFRNQLWYRKKA